MTYKQCVVCGLNLPISVLIPVQVRHQGKIVVVPVCERCKLRKEQEAKEIETKRKPNSNIIAPKNDLIDEGGF